MLRQNFPGAPISPSAEVVQAPAAVRESPEHVKCGIVPEAPLELHIINKSFSLLNYN
jgi:hypothetical protein